MGCPRMFRGRTFKCMKRLAIFATIAALVVPFLQILSGLCTNYSIRAGFCNFRGFMIIIAAVLGWFAFCFLTSLVYNLFLKRFLARLFPMSCGHRKCIFTGKSSKSLSELLLTIDKELPTEEVVYQDHQNTVLPFLEDIRNTLQTNNTPALSSEPILAGSLTERYGIPFSYKKAKIAGYGSALKSDIDVMICFDPEVMDASFSGLDGNILIDFLSPFLGYVQLTFKASGDVISSENIIEQVKHAVSCTKNTNFPRVRCGESLVEGLKCEVKGPAVNVSIKNVVDFDITPCIKCREWPPLSDWPTRQRCWPNQEDVTRIVSNGCHLVAKPAPFDKEQTSWRFSFSVAEVELSKLVPNTARKCFLALKIILKDHLQPVVAEITSYHLKTIFLNTLEKTPVDFWVDENIERCFFSLLNELHNALVSGMCPHHWFRSVNFFGKFNDPEQVAVLIKKLEMIAENPAPFIFDDGCCCLYPCCTRERLYDYDEHDPGHPSTSLESVDHEKGTSHEQSVIINVQRDDTDDEIDGIVDDNDDGDVERRPILHHTSSLSKYGAIKL